METGRGRWRGYGDIGGRGGERHEERKSAELTQFFQPRSLEIVEHVHIYHALVGVQLNVLFCCT